MRTRAINYWLITQLTNGTRYSCRIIQSQCLIVRCKWAALPPWVITLYFSMCVEHTQMRFLADEEKRRGFLLCRFAAETSTILSCVFLT